MSNLAKEKKFFDNQYEENPRERLGQIYSIIKCRNDFYHDLIYNDIEGLEVLEYGCGTGSHSVELARRGGLVTGIDISEVGIHKATEIASSSNLTNIKYHVMDAQNMTFSDNSFDRVIGEGILHHLDLEQSYREISRVLKPGGQAVFMEPLGHNVAMRVFRHFTPSMRTDDEHPLVKDDLDLADQYFSHNHFEYFHLSSFGALLFLKTPWFYNFVAIGDKLDRLLFKYFPRLGLHSWYAVMVLRK